MNSLENKYESKGIKRGGLLLFSKPIAIEFIEDCKKLNIDILGIDGFILSGEKTQPSLANSIDYSGFQEKANLYHKAITFLDSQNDNLYFEIICNE